MRLTLDELRTLALSAQFLRMRLTRIHADRASRSATDRWSERLAA